MKSSILLENSWPFIEFSKFYDLHIYTVYVQTHIHMYMSVYIHIKQVYNKFSSIFPKTVN